MLLEPVKNPAAKSIKEVLVRVRTEHNPVARIVSVLETLPNITKTDVGIFCEKNLTLSSKNPYEFVDDETCELDRIYENGQLKLLFAELNFISRYVNTDEHVDILYIGASPGTHIDKLVSVLCEIDSLTFHLFDPEKIQTNDDYFGNRCIIYQRLFTDADYQIFCSMNNLYIISDIRNTNIGINPEESYHIIQEDMLLQLSWCKDLKPVKALLKFRIPLPEECSNVFSFEYPEGALFLQPFLKAKSVELRFVPDNYTDMINWQIKDIYDRMLYHNRVVRTCFNFKNPFTETYSPIYPKKSLFCNWDSACMAFIVINFLTFSNVEPTYLNFMKFMDFILDDKLQIS